nr:SAM-dependent methyltransferase [Helicobacter sp. 'CLO3_human']
MPNSTESSAKESGGNKLNEAGGNSNARLDSGAESSANVANARANTQTSARHTLNPANKQFISLHSHNASDFFTRLSGESDTPNDSNSQNNSSNPNNPNNTNNLTDFFAQNVIYISDAGMPSICDPGAALVAFARAQGIAYDVLPGACALSLAYTFSGVESNAFIFGGFLAQKREARRAQILHLIDSDMPIIAYESPHRLLESLADFALLAPTSHIFAIKEMTKLHQKSFYGTPESLLNELKNANIQGEWALVIIASKAKSLRLDENDILNLTLPTKTTAKLLAKLHDKDAKQIYKELIEQTQGAQNEQIKQENENPNRARQAQKHAPNQNRATNTTKAKHKGK